MDAITKQFRTTLPHVYGKKKHVHNSSNNPPKVSERERFRKRERRERHFPKILGSGASRERLLYIYIYIYIYIYVYIQQKHAKRQISCKMYENMHICACR
jgi:hypothetical protein